MFQLHFVIVFGLSFFNLDFMHNILLKKFEKQMNSFGSSTHQNTILLRREIYTFIKLKIFPKENMYTNVWFFLLIILIRHRLHVDVCVGVLRAIFPNEIGCVFVCMYYVASYRYKCVAKMVECTTACVFIYLVFNLNDVAWNYLVFSCLFFVYI